LRLIVTLTKINFFLIARLIALLKMENSKTKK